MGWNKKGGGYDSSLYNTPIYRSWYNMKSRCNNPNYLNYHLWGGRGITYNKKWESFLGFYEDMYQLYTEHSEKFGENNTSLDRIDNDKGYSKSNCRWATKRVQANNRRTSKILEFNGKKQTLAQWARELKIKSSTLRQRIYCYKWSVEKALAQ
jgi:hypothetical protein